MEQRSTCASLRLPQRCVINASCRCMPVQAGLAYINLRSFFGVSVCESTPCTHLRRTGPARIPHVRRTYRRMPALKTLPATGAVTPCLRNERRRLRRAARVRVYLPGWTGRYVASWAAVCLVADARPSPVDEAVVAAWLRAYRLHDACWRASRGTHGRASLVRSLTARFTTLLLQDNILRWVESMSVDRRAARLQRPAIQLPVVKTGRIEERSQL